MTDTIPSVPSYEPPRLTELESIRGLVLDEAKKPDPGVATAASTAGPA